MPNMVKREFGPRTTKVTNTGIIVDAGEVNVELLMSPRAMERLGRTLVQTAHLVNREIRKDSEDE